MKHVTIRDLHEKTGHWVRLASPRPLPDRELEIAKLPRTPDSGAVISEDRDRA